MYLFHSLFIITFDLHCIVSVVFTAKLSSSYVINLMYLIYILLIKYVNVIFLPL